MRFSAVLSALFHVAIIVAAMTTLANPDRFFIEAPVNIPVELLSLADITNISAAVVEAEEEPAPIDEEVVEDVVPEPQRVAALPDPVLTLPEEEPEFSPFEEPVPVEAEPDPAPPPTPDLGDVRPSLRPRPPERRREFDFASAADALLDLTPQEEEEPVFVLEGLQIEGQVPPEVADEARARVGLGTGLTISQEDALKADIQACWNIPAGALDAENLRIELRIHFNPDGTVQRVEIIDQARYNSDGFYRAAVDSAVRAVARCETGTRFDGSFRRGYDLPRDRYEDWRTVGVTFDPSKMF